MNLRKKIFENLVDLKDSDKIFYMRGNETRTYADVFYEVSRIFDAFDKAKLVNGSYVAVEGVKTFQTYCIILASYLRGIAYIPFTQAQSATRVAMAFEQLEVKYGFYSTEVFQSSLPIENLSKALDKCSPISISEQAIDDNSYAYIMFSSGTTGEPKIIPITNSNLNSYIGSIDKLYSFEEYSGFSQIADLTFDLSVHDYFLCLLNRGFIFPINSNEALLAYRFVNQFEIKYWMSVPSTASFMFQLIKKKFEMNSLKVTFFLGEALTWEVVDRWRKVAPNTEVINLYGPTECTVACSYFDTVDQESRSQTAIVPIGKALPNAEIKLSGENPSELLLGGDQLFNGYLGVSSNLNNTKIETNANERWYYSGDLVEQIEDTFYFRGRTDFQIKLRGYRIEVEELEALIEKNSDFKVCIVPLNQIQEGNYDSLGLCYAGRAENQDFIKSLIKEYFPSYASVSKLKYIDQLHTNINGKLDREKILGDFK